MKKFIALLLVFFLYSYTAWAGDVQISDQTPIQALGGHGGGGGHPGPIHPGPAPHPVHPGPVPRPYPGPGLGHGHPSYPSYPIHHGVSPWPYWGHPYFVRPVYYWNWGAVMAVTCVAEDSQGSLYPVTDDGYVANYENMLPQIEDEALNRCYYETGGDPGCFLLECQPTY